MGDAPMIFCAARLQKEKDIPTLIKAAGELRRRLQGTGGDEVTGYRLQGTVGGDEVTGYRGQGTGLAGQPAGRGPAGGEPTESAALPQNSNSYLLTPNSSGNSSPQFFIAGEGDQRAECERLIAALRFNDHGSRNVEQKLGVRSWKLEDGATPQALPAGPNESAALPQHSNSYLLTSNSSQPDAVGIRLLGFRSDVSVLMAACDIFVLPAPAEPFGLVIIEAMALGKPVIAAGAGGPVEIVVDGETGLLFEPGNSQSLAVAMQRLLIDAPLRQRMGEASRQRYAKFFTADQMAKKMLAVYAATGGEVRS